MRPTCTAPDCARVINARGLCGLHYTHAQRAGLFGTPCTVEGCGKPRVASGLCSTHHKAAERASKREQFNAYQRAYMRTYKPSPTTRAKMLAGGERYRRNNLALFADKERIRRGRKRANGGNYTRRDWLRLVRRHGGRCAYCLTAPATTADHVIPVVRGGSNFIGNILPACVPCNSSKQDLLLVEWKHR